MPAQILPGVSLSKVPTDNKLVSFQDSIVNDAVLDLLKRSPIPGLSIGIYQRGQSSTYNYGETEKGENKLPAANTIYDIASISKTFTGILLAKAAIEKRLNLDDDIRKYLNGSYPNLEYKGLFIKLKYLTNHRSGIPFSLPDDPSMMPGFNNDIEPWATRVQLRYQHYTRNDFYKDLRLVKLDTIPGYNASYSNAAVQLLSYILEKVYHKSFENILKDKITRPLQMTQTKITLTKMDSLHLAKGYDETGLQLPYIPDIFLGAASIKSSVNDLLKYIKWNLQAKDEAVKLSHKNIWGDNDYYSTGLNWQELHSNGYTVIWQSGMIPGFQSFCVFYPGLDMGIVVLSNESEKTLGRNLELLINQVMPKLNKRVVVLP
jgi:D-alanyl-D-alanine-carboxypeptidase/D-alanyl-D-alanine-endopeptidase